jgi:hypothetical protein
MSTRNKRFLTFLLYAAIVGSFGCTTTTYRSTPHTHTKTTQLIEPSEAVTDIYHAGKIEEPPKKICTVLHRVAVATTQYGNIASGSSPVFTIHP